MDTKKDCIKAICRLLYNSCQVRKIKISLSEASFSAEKNKSGDILKASWLTPDIFVFLKEIKVLIVTINIIIITVDKPKKAESKLAPIPPTQKERMKQLPHNY